MQYDYKEVCFDQYCKTCKYRDHSEYEEPCEECTANPVHLHSHKPVKYEKGERHDKGKKADRHKNKLA